MIGRSGQTSSVSLTHEDVSEWQTCTVSSPCTFAIQKHPHSSLGVLRKNEKKIMQAEVIAADDSETRPDALMLDKR
jgi:hypothetical protein